MQRINSYLIRLLLVLGSLVAMLPIYMAIVNSFKTQGEMFQSFIALPTTFHWENYSDAFNKINLLGSSLNSAIVSFLGIGGIVFCASLAGYKLSRTSGRLSNLIFFLFVASMLVPFHSIMIPLTRVAKGLHVQGSTYGLALIYIGLGVNMAIFLYHGFVKSIPRELEESAQMDGCNEFQTFFQIIFPLLLPITVTIAILDFLWIWNDFLLPLLMLTDVNRYTLILSTNMLFGEYNKEWPLILSSLVLTAIPVVLIYAFFQKFIMEGIAEGAVKG
ncbi:raffinose/stachyose/melibiose transport system permease protein [Paenibacillus sp. ov031]|jgi:raffinose/stachyose/melibiose transport system permease protein|nr:L-arabinose transport system permease protein AraQ [Paenibacillus sp. AD87]PWW37238.1 raffinose/stachyose/melibiose transport system permease protein [Paenibacillus pabuli]PXW05381.1 raffinose/stachyose/melibiose transport system permease protein [Paenibacillus taichungensis]SDK89781.1 raffinose/stachyose/melibiose transport system permease protein [Paenibacillus sp. OK060]SEB18172.1 raffinose/stachyose/melibiose transport system permease protein [Paenibacillus sp. 276b]SEK52073.1 raffinose